MDIVPWQRFLLIISGNVSWTSPILVVCTYTESYYHYCHFLPAAGILGLLHGALSDACHGWASNPLSLSKQQTVDSLFLSIRISVKTGQVLLVSKLFPCFLTNT